MLGAHSSASGQILNRPEHIDNFLIHAIATLVPK